LLPSHEFFSTMCFHLNILPHHSPTAMELINHELKSLKLRAKIILFSEFLMSGICYS
jgi:hypothetical protein